MSTATKKNYANAMKRLEKAGLVATDYDGVCGWVNGQELSLNSKKMYYVALADYFKTDDPVLADRYKEQYVGMTSVLVAKSKEQKLTDAEREKYLPYERIQEVFYDAWLSPHESLEDKMLVGFYTRMPPVRADYSRLRVYYNTRPDTSENHIQIWGDGKHHLHSCSVEVFIGQHKTASSAGTLKRIVPGEVKHMLFEYLRAYSAMAGVSLPTYMSREEPIYLFDFAPAEITTRLQRVFLRYTGKAVSVNIIRHSYITKQMEGRPPLAQLEAEAGEMGHSVATHETYRRLDA
jgi:hypothetical protein